LMDDVADRGARLEIGLDLLVSEGVPVGFSQMFIEAVMMEPNERLGRTLSLKTPLLRSRSPRPCT
jgi:hypothetical protein